MRYFILLIFCMLLLCSCDESSKSDPDCTLQCEHGTCLIANDTESCSCDDGYQGTLCDTAVASCDGINCGEYGTCVITNNIASCSCDEGYHVDQLTCVKDSIYQIDVKMPVGMNLPSLNYYTPTLIFTDVMTTASKLIPFYDGSGWDSGTFDQLDLDENGYPTSLPQSIDGNDTVVRFMLNNYYKGTYRVFYDGIGKLEGKQLTETDGKLYLELNGEGGHLWVDIKESDPNDHLRNIHILPVAYESAYENGETIPTFNPKFTEGLKPFHALRFMDWIHTNGSTQVHWSDRATNSYYSQGTGRGISFEYAIELCNALDMDAWVTVPHKASDDYIRQMARLWRDNLEPGRMIYLEYSNEIWNWGFSQAGWIVNNATDSVESYIPTDLAEIAPAGEGHPEKDAYMIARVFRIWSEEFGDDIDSRVIRVATGQHAWVDNTRRILKYLFETDGIGADAMSVAGYFNFNQALHDEWNTEGRNVTSQEICEGVEGVFDETSGSWTRGTAEYVNQYNVDYLVYEGGQHMQPWQQQDNLLYSQALWDAQISPEMYLLYKKNFELHGETAVNCKLFMAFSYVGTRESRYGSWGHLESLDQIGTDYFETAPKYKALLDANTPR